MPRKVDSPCKSILQPSLYKQYPALIHIHMPSAGRGLKTVFNIVEALFFFFTLMSVLYDDVQMDQ